MAAHRMIVIAVQLMVLATMGLLLWQASTDWPEYWVIAMVFGPPILALVAILIPLSRKARIVGLYLSAMTMVPAAAFGIFGGWGVLYVISAIFLLYAAWQENEEIVEQT